MYPSLPSLIVGDEGEGEGDLVGRGRVEELQCHACPSGLDGAVSPHGQKVVRRIIRLGDGVIYL